MILYLCEKPSQARDIGRILNVTSRREGYLQGSGKQVTWCIGHLLEMSMPDAYKPEWKSWSLHSLPIIPDHWTLEVKKSVGKQFRIIKKLLKNVDQVVIATDADREGETIGREVLQQCGYRGQVNRLWLSALDDRSIQKALNSLMPGHQTEALYQAGLGRARADWLVGMNLSRAYTLLGQKGGYDGVLTVGRVQTPTLKLVVDRDRLIEAFKPVAYFELTVILSVEKGWFRAVWLPDKKSSDEEGRCLDPQLARGVAQKVLGHRGVIQKAQTKRMREPPPLPLELSTLQQEASRRWSMGAKRVLDVAQSLYETHKAITYPRTDCRYLPTNQFSEVPTIVQGLVHGDPSMASLVSGANLSLRSRAWNDTKITAHHAIIPTASWVYVSGLSLEEKNLFDLIRRHYLAQFFPFFEYDQTMIETNVQKELFRASGRVTVIPGWKQVLPGKAMKEHEKPEQPLPAVKVGESALVEKTDVEEKSTTPPNRYTEGTLIQAMKNVGKTVEDQRLRAILRQTSGIGTEATRASIIETLLKRHLLKREGKKSLISQPVGRLLVDALPHSVTDPATTAVWEQVLDDIANGRETLDLFLGKSITWITRLIGNVKARELAGINSFSGLADYPTPTPTSKKRIVKSRVIQTESSKTNPSKAKVFKKTAVDSGILCPKCQRGTLLQRTARQGKQAGNPFYGCSCYPECRFTRPV